MAAFAQNWMREPPHLPMARWPGIYLKTNSVVIPTVRHSNRQNVSTETKWSRNLIAQTRDICGRVYRQSQITKRKPALSWTLTSYSQTTAPPTWDCGLSFSVADVSKTFKRVNRRMAPGPDGILAASSEHVQTSWLVCLRTYSINPYPSLLSPHASRWPPLFMFPRNLSYHNRHR